METEAAFVTGSFPMAGGDNADGVHLIYGASQRYTGEFAAHDVGATLLASGGPAYANHMKVSAAGDIDGDGLDDLLADVRFEIDGGVESIKSYLVRGNTTRLGGTVPLEGADAIFEGSADGYVSGLGSAGAGDVDGDGFADLMYSAVGDGNVPDPYRTGILYGSADGPPASFGPDALETVFGWESMWFTLGGLGDLDGDGRDELSPATHEAIPVYLGDGDRLPDNVDWPDAAFTIMPDGPSDHLVGLASGDFDGDGLRDLVMADSGYEGDGSASGAVYVLPGASGPYSGDRPLTEADVVMLGQQRTLANGDLCQDRLGYGTSSGGDVDGDGADDILVSALGNIVGDDDGGYVFLIFGGEYAQP